MDMRIEANAQAAHHAEVRLNRVEGSREMSLVRVLEVDGNTILVGDAWGEDAYLDLVPLTPLRGTSHAIICGTQAGSRTCLAIPRMPE